MTDAARPFRKARRVQPPSPAEASSFAESPTALAQGYHSVSGEGLPSAAVSGRAEKGGASSTVTYTVCTDIQKLAKALEIDQSLSVGFGPFGLDQKLKFVEKLEVTTYGISIAIYARHALGTETLLDVALKDGVAPPANDEETREFVRVYGDSFVSSAMRGGEYYAVYTFYSQTKEEQKTLETELKAKGIFNGVTVNTGLQSKLNDFVSTTTTRVAFSQDIAGIASPSFPEPDDAIKFALGFPAMELTAPTVVGFGTTGYERVPKFGAFTKVVDNRQYFIGRGLEGGLTADLVHVQQLLSQIGQIDEVYKFYGGFDDEKLQKVKGLARTDRGEIDRQMGAFQDDPVQTFTKPALPSLKEGLPVLTYKAGKSDTYGGGGGEPFEDVNPATAIEEQTRIVSVQMRSGARVDRLLTTYRNMHDTWTVTRGREGGSLGPILRLLRDEFIVAADLRSGTRIDRLELTSDTGQSIKGGREGGKPFHWDVPEGATVFGFSGRAGKEIDALALHYVTFQPAKWT